jgi:predicted DNA-binding transcriptional regulator YafY
MSVRSGRGIASEGLVDPERLRKALSLIREAGATGITRERLRQDLGQVSLRTVDRAMSLLEAQGAHIQRERRGWPSTVYFILDKGPAWDEHISPETRLALRLAGLTLAQSGTLLWQDKLEVLERLASDRMSSRDRRLFETLQKAVQVQGGVDDPIESPDILEPILRALEGQRVVDLDYQAAGARAAISMSMIPYALTHDLFSGGAFLLVWDSGRERPLHLRLSRIGKVRVTSRIGTFPAELMARAARYQIGGWTSANEPFEVEARIRGAHWIQAFKEAPPSLPDFQANPARDGKTVLVRFKANHTHGASRWLMQFGASAEVLAPASLRTEIKAQFQAAVAQYD